MKSVLIPSHDMTTLVSENNNQISNSVYDLTVKPSDRSLPTVFLGLPIIDKSRQETKNNSNTYNFPI